MNGLAVSSFISEHTAEFVIVPALTRLLETRFSRIQPFFFWRTREGSATAVASASRGARRVLVVYPRRPKVGSRSEIWVKFNRELFEDAQYWLPDAVPVLAGVPCAGGMAEIHSRTMCLWFALDGNDAPEDRVCRLVPTSGTASDVPSQARPLSDENLLSLTLAAGQMTWIELVDRIRSRPRQRNGGPFYLGGYKPIYFVLED